MKKLFLSTLLIILIFTACAPSESAIAEAISQTEAAQPTITTVPTATPLPPTNTPIPPTETPTNIPPTPTNAITNNDGIPVLAHNFLGEVDYDGFIIRIFRVLVGEKQYYIDKGTQPFDQDPRYDDVALVGEILFEIENTTSNIVTVHPTFGTVLVNSTQIDLSTYSIFSRIGDTVSGEILPGARLIGGTWFGITRIEYSDVYKMVITFSAPTIDSRSLGNDFYFEIDLSDHTFNPLPPLD